MPGARQADNLSNVLSLAPELVARRLLGCYLIRTLGTQDIICKIVETEAYDQNDPASHSFRGETLRNAVMFGPSGFAYVYFTYGMHYCFNVVTGPKGYASAVLIRAIEPVTGLDLIKDSRPNVLKGGVNLTNGPGKLTQALAIGLEFNAHDLSKKPLRLELKSEQNLKLVASSPRVGISQAKDLKWRFYIKDNPYVSR